MLDVISWKRGQEILHSSQTGRISERKNILVSDWMDGNEYQRKDGREVGNKEYTEFEQKVIWTNERKKRRTKKSDSLGSVSSHSSYSPSLHLRINHIACQVKGNMTNTSLLNHQLPLSLSILLIRTLLLSRRDDHQWEENPSKKEDTESLTDLIYLFTTIPSGCCFILKKVQGVSSSS